MGLELLVLGHGFPKLMTAGSDLEHPLQIKHIPVS